MSPRPGNHATAPQDAVIDFPSADALRADDAWWTLYQSSFPPTEREPRDIILRSLNLGVGIALRATQGGQTVGLATIHLLRRPAAVFLVYLAVDPDSRRAGLGARLVEAAWTAGAERLRASGLEPQALVCEVDPADTGGAVCKRRIGFFERLGVRVVSTNYCQPPVDGATAVRMWLMARGPVDVRELVRAIYFEKYAAVNGIARKMLTIQDKH